MGSKLRPEYAKNLLPGDIFYMMNENYFEKRGKSPEWDGKKMWCAAIRRVDGNHVDIQAILYDDFWVEENTWPKSISMVIPYVRTVWVEDTYTIDELPGAIAEFSDNLADLISFHRQRKLMNPTSIQASALALKITLTLMKDQFLGSDEDDRSE